MTRTLLITASLGLLLVAPTPAVATSAPSNDLIANAITLTTLPFDTTVDLGGATSSPSDPVCSEGDGHTVWYRFTPTRSGLYGATGGGDSDVIIATGPRSAPVAVACLGGWTTWQATAGTRYWIEVAQCCGSPGALTAVHVERIRRFTVTIGLDPTATVNHAGLLTLTGTLTCDRSVVIFGDEMLGEATEKAGKYQAMSGLYTGNDNITCSPTPTPWSTTAVSYTGANFVVGTAAVSLGSDEGFCSYFDCGREVDVNTGVRVVRG